MRITNDYRSRNMDNIEELFHQNDNVFTVFVVGQSFAVGRGYKYLNSLLGLEK